MNKRKEIKEQNVSGAVGGFQSPKAFSTMLKVGSPFNTRVERPKRPSHTKMFDFK